MKSNSIVIQKAADEAKKIFQSIGYPSKRDESWRMIDLSNVLSTQFIESKKQPIDVTMVSDFLIDDCYHIFSINGFLNLELSDKLPPCINLSTIEESQVNLEGRFAKISDCKNNGFNAKNTSKFKDGIMLNISSKQKIDKPIQLLNIFLNSEDSSIHYPRLLIIVDNQSELSLINHFICTDKNQHLVNSVVEIDVQENSTFNYSVIQIGNSSSNIIESTSSNQSSNSIMNYNSFSLDGKMSRNDINLRLNKDLAEINLHGLFLGSDSQFVDYHTTINHVSPNCNSNEIFQGVMNENSKGVFNGLVNVSQYAKNTNSNQKNRNLLLSNQATVNSNPQLEIFCDDVSCTHGSTTGYLDKDMIFYLQSRGIDKEKAKQILIYGFAKEIIDHVTHESTKIYLDSCVNSWMNK